MSTVLAVIPARGGSKGVPAKNLAQVGGVPLVARAVRACLGSRLVTHVVVSTDDAAIAGAARAAGAEVVQRPPAIAGDTATSESAVLHAMDAHEAIHGAAAEAVLLVQCTSPFLTSADVDGVASAVVEDGADTAVTVAPFHAFVWRRTSEVTESPEDAQGVNHDKSYRPRRQDRPEDFVETGAAYAMNAAGFRVHGHRFFGRTALVETDPARVLEIDDHHELARARALAPLLDPPRPVRPDERAGSGACSCKTEEEVDAVGAPPVPEGLRGSRRPTTTPQMHVPGHASPAGPTGEGRDPAPVPTRSDVDAVVLDFDGTQTDDRVLIDSDGRELVAVHRGDGLGIAALRRAGLKLLILSTEQNPVVAARARKLNIPVLHGIDRKDLALKEWCEENAVEPERVLYAGNDVNDLPCFGLVGWPVAVASAHDSVRAAARAVTTTPGGAGAIREIAAWLLGPTLNTPTL
ncbi:N-acylneuraminate cytidylyltransferase [Streptomyces sp. FIT100]|uniref:N-acylneuraminate cytidylyltransferase n=1 Tax=Streptomyces sp. FIT100 TaxID=2837956 RepID=UPI0021C62EFB|nr:N-acylneuraminate cytidylyltransferase [Streptomyces sp. FIT100]UUN28773.1 N-acylneuraminate cytidylyltransferase [Streptomyces sp. FIT100]